MSTKTYHLGLIGYPLGHSLSPKIHGAAFQALGVPGKYKLYPVSPKPDTTHQQAKGIVDPGAQAKLTLVDLLTQMREGQIHGLNVTIPHKQNVIPYLDKLTPAAETIGAVNTIFVQADRLIGDNTDAPGFWKDLQNLAIGNQQHNNSALILGAGGSARAVVYALLTHGYHVSITARRIEQAQELCRQLSVINNQISIVDSVNRYLDTDRYSLLVNTTPVGMHPDDNKSPWPADIPLPKNAAVYDLVYNPSETLLFRHARGEAVPVTTGLGMLIEQAALAFERWTGLDAPRREMRQVVEP